MPDRGRLSKVTRPVIEAVGGLSSFICAWAGKAFVTVKSKIAKTDWRGRVDISLPPTSHCLRFIRQFAYWARLFSASDSLFGGSLPSQLAFTLPLLSTSSIAGVP